MHAYLPNMTDWTECAHVYANNSMGMLGGVTSVKFDPYSELVWAGSASGQISSHFGPELQRYTSFAAHSNRGLPALARDITIDDRHVYSVGEGSLHCASRRGVARWGILTK